MVTRVPSKPLVVFHTLRPMHPYFAAIALTVACAPVTLPPPAVEPKSVAVDAAKEKTDGFVALFNNTALDGWIGDTKGYKVETLKDGAAIVCQPNGTNLYTKDEFADFEFRFEFQLAPGANNGIALRSPNEGDPAYVGFECQVLDNTAEQYKGLERWQYHGSIYGIAAATATALKPVGEWNQETITMKGPKVKVELNGVVIIDIDLDKVAPDGKTVSGHKVDGLTRKTGHLGFCGHGDRVAFKNLRVKRI